MSACKTLEDAARLIRAVGAPNLRLTVDVLHMMRSGDTVADVAALDPALIDYAQISDGPAEADADAHALEALCNRGLPGEGVFPLTDLIRALPEATTVCIEAPTQRFSESMTPVERATLARDATAALLWQAGRDIPENWPHA